MRHLHLLFKTLIYYTIDRNILLNYFHIYLFIYLLVCFVKYDTPCQFVFSNRFIVKKCFFFYLLYNHFRCPNDISPEEKKIYFDLKTI